MTMERKAYPECRRLLRYEAGRGRKRALMAGVDIDYDDIHQELCLVFAEAQREFDPNLGVPFTAYLTNQCRFRAADLVISACKRRKIAPMVELDDVLIEVVPCGTHDPEWLAIKREEIRLAAAAMSPLARQIVANLVQPSAEVRYVWEAHKARSERLKARGKGATRGENLTAEMIRKAMRVPHGEYKAAWRELGALAGA